MRLVSDYWLTSFSNGCKAYARLKGTPVLNESYEEPEYPIDPSDLLLNQSLCKEFFGVELDPDTFVHWLSKS